MDTKLSILFTKEEINRIKERIMGGTKDITVDLHGLTVREARRMIGNLVALNRDECSFKLVHGYNHGTAIKQMIWNDFKNNRIVSMETEKRNPGKTVIRCRAA